jgi:hypothetical protein
VVDAVEIDALERCYSKQRERPPHPFHIGAAWYEREHLGLGDK